MCYQAWIHHVSNYNSQTLLFAVFLTAGLYFMLTTCWLHTFVSNITGPCVGFVLKLSSLILVVPPPWILVTFYDTTDAFSIGFRAVRWSLVRICQKLKEWQKFFEIQDCVATILNSGPDAISRQHICLFNRIHIFPPNLVKTGQIANTSKQFFFQNMIDGGSHHFGF